jgi:DNA-directed RNA polymerase specialized sigma24 family protein
MSKDPLTEEALNKLLHWLNPDRDLAGHVYNKVQSRLTGIFNAHGCADPEKLADETFDRILSKIDWLNENYVGNPMHYLSAVARNIIKEDYRERTAARALPQPEPVDSGKESERRQECLDQCLEELSQDGRTLLIKYYEGEGREKIANRKKLAGELGVTLRALRLRVFHLKAPLKICVEICLRRGAEYETL